MADPKYSGVLEAPRAQVVRWLQSDMFSAQLSSLFPLSDANKVGSRREVLPLWNCCVHHPCILTAIQCMRADSCRPQPLIP